MEVELFDGRVKAIIDPKGAWVTNLSDEYGDVLFPRRILTDNNGDKKVRGGCHVCLPNFGPGGAMDMPQHGFGRTALWEIVEATPISAIFRLAHGEAEYQSLYSEIAYRIDSNQLLMTLSVTNNSRDVLRVAPGFHPYLMGERGAEIVMIDNEAIPTDELNEAQFAPDSNKHIVEANKTRYSLDADNLSTWAKWTDNLGPYICVEPTAGGFTFLNQEVSPKEQLAPGETKKYTARIAWERSR